MRRLKTGDKVQLMVNTRGGYEGARNMTLETGAVTGHAGGLVLVTLVGETHAMACHRQDLAPVPATEYLSPEERAVVSRRKIEVQNTACAS